jgi:NADPH-dependent 2,4-dienoyl-CoA reductase/sulfur reductase-like enzyme
MDTIAVVGASLAGLSATRALRAAGFEGRLIVIGDEVHDPYDRPPLSKDFLAGRQEVADLALTMPSDAELKLEWRLGQCATALAARPEGGYLIELAGGESVACDGVVIATGARARQLPTADGAGPLRGVHTLRTLDDALALRAELVPGARLVVVGGGFIGAEIASTAHELGVKVTLVELAPTALAGPLGEELGAVFAALHVTRGVEVLTGVPVASLTAQSELAAQGARVAGVRLADGRELPADVVLVGIGSIPNTEWLAGSGVLGAGPDGDLAAGVAITEGGATNLPGVVATGDCAATYSRFADRVVRYEHWTNALQHPSLAAATLLGQPAPRQSTTAGVPYFWSDQFGLRLQFAGHYHQGDVVEVVEGDVTTHNFVAVYRRAGRLVAVLGIGQPKIFGRWRKQLAQNDAAAGAPAGPAL